jgi:hypothetical protein
MTEKLDYKLNVWSFYDLALFKLHANKTLQNEVGIKAIEELC